MTTITANMSAAEIVAGMLRQSRLASSVVQGRSAKKSRTKRSLKSVFSPQNPQEMADLKGFSDIDKTRVADPNGGFGGATGSAIQGHFGCNQPFFYLGERQATLSSTPPTTPICSLIVAQNSDGGGHG
jgi:hypothetical protein